MVRKTLTQSGNQKEKCNKVVVMNYFICMIFILVSCNNYVPKTKTIKTKDSLNNFKVSDSKPSKKEQRIDSFTLGNREVKRQSADSITKKDTSKTTPLKALDTLKLYNKRLVGEIILSKNKWYIVSGRSCDQCDEKYLYIYFPSWCAIISRSKINIM